jgi:hypothetical protein
LRLVHHLYIVSRSSSDATSIEHTVNSVVSTASGVACAVADHPILCGDHVSTPAVKTIGETHDVLVLLQTNQLAVTRTLEVVVAMVLEWGAGREAANAAHGTRGLGYGGRCNVVFDGCGGRVSGGCEQHRCRCKHGCESDEHHDCGDGGLVIVGTRC